jgi:hypothetical protein
VSIRPLVNVSVVSVYIDTADWWIGYYKGSNYHFVCPLPTVVVRWPRRGESWRAAR